MDTNLRTLRIIFNWIKNVKYFVKHEWNFEKVVKINEKNFCVFSNSFEQSDGQKREETAVVNNLGSENESISVTGSFSFVGDDGQTYTVTYIADENGFQPSAPHIPAA